MNIFTYIDNLKKRKKAFQYLLIISITTQKKQHRLRKDNENFYVIYNFYFVQKLFSPSSSDIAIHWNIIRRVENIFERQFFHSSVKTIELRNFKIKINHFKNKITNLKNSKKLN